MSFKVKALRWVPHLPPVEIEDATPRQLDAMQVTPSNSKVSPYVRTLVHDPDSYVARTTLFNLIMYSEGGLAQEHRELAALAASAENGCAYCASVHARKHITLTGDPSIVQSLYTGGAMGDVPPLAQTIVAFARAMSQTPVAIPKALVEDLRAHDLTADEVVDLVHSAAIFGWANRLMHTLGHAEPLQPART